MPCSTRHTPAIEEIAGQARNDHWLKNVAILWLLHYMHAKAGTLARGMVENAVVTMWYTQGY